MKCKSILRVYELWNELRGFRVAPDRMLISPQLFSEELPDMFLLNGPDDAFRFRLAGSRLTECFGTSLTGNLFVSQVQLDKQTIAQELLEMVVAASEPVFCSITLTSFGEPEGHLMSGFPKRTHSGEMVLLPLRHDGRFDLRLLGAARLFDMPSISHGRAYSLDIVSHRVLGARARPMPGVAIGSHLGSAKIIIRKGSLCLLETSQA